MIRMAIGFGIGVLACKAVETWPYFRRYRMPPLRVVSPWGNLLRPVHNVYEEWAATQAMNGQNGQPTPALHAAANGSDPNGQPYAQYQPPHGQAQPSWPETFFTQGGGISENNN